MTEIGSLRHPIKIEQPIKASDGAGGYTQTWSQFHSCAAAIKPVSASERLFGQKILSAITHKITIRYKAGITSSMRASFTFAGVTRLFQIHGVINEDERSRWLTLLCQEGVGS